MPGYEVVIIGDRLPTCINNVTQINVRDIPNRKQLTIKTKIAAALQYSEEIFFSNDDIFLLQTIDPYNFPFYSNGRLDRVTEGGAKSLAIELQKQGKPIRHFDGHFPILYQRSKFEALERFSSDTIIKSAYCNYNAIQPVETQDCKILRKMTTEQIRAFVYNRPCFSTTDGYLSYCIPFLQELFPHKSRFEI